MAVAAPARMYESGTPATKKNFKDYEPGFLQIDIKYLPQMPNQTATRHLFVAIDQATRWVFICQGHCLSRALSPCHISAASWA